MREKKNDGLDRGKSYTLRRIIAFVITWVLIIGSAACKSQEKNDSKLFPMESIYMATQDIEDSDYSELSNIEKETSALVDDNLNESNYETSSGLPQEEQELFLITEEDALLFFNTIICSLDRESSYTSFLRPRELLFDESGFPGLLNTLLAYERASELNHDLPEIDVEDVRTTYSKRTDEDAVLVALGFSEADIAWFCTEETRDWSYDIYYIPFLQTVYDYYFGVGTLDSSKMKVIDKNSNALYITEDHQYIAYINGRGGPSGRTLFRLVDIHLSETGISSIDVNCLSIFAGLWDAIKREYVCDFSLFDLGVDYYESSNEEFLNEIMSLTDVNFDSFGILNIEFFKDETGLHIYDVHYPSSESE